MIQIILASSSPRRRLLLKKLNLKFKIIKPFINEKKILKKINNNNPYTVACLLAFEKALSVAKKIKNRIILGADTIVVLKNEIIGKPENVDDAVKILKKLSGSTHRVITGVALINSETFNFITFSDTSYVSFKKLKLKEILNYIKNNNVMDKAGAYAIQEGADPFIKEIKGSYDNVVGLPTEKLKKVLGVFKKL
jgi:septum formation protein